MLHPQAIQRPHLLASGTCWTDRLRWRQRGWSAASWPLFCQARTQAVCFAASASWPSAHKEGPASCHLSSLAQSCPTGSRACRRALGKHRRATVCFCASRRRAWRVNQHCRRATGSAKGTPECSPRAPVSAGRAARAPADCKPARKRADGRAPRSVVAQPGTASRVPASSPVGTNWSGKLASAEFARRKVRRPRTLPAELAETGPSWKRPHDCRR